MGGGEFSCWDFDLSHRNSHGISPLHTLDELGEIGGVLGLNSATDDGRDGELHGLDGASVISGADGTGLEEVLVDANKGTGVSGGDVGDL